MLNVPGESHTFCDGVSRRSFLKIGGLALGGLSLPQLLAAESQAGIRRSHKAVIMIYLPGGPPHQDMFDLKPNAPQEVRGEFSPIKTNVPGIEISELLPRMARSMDKLVPIRTLVGSAGRHDSFQCMTGRTPGNQPPGGWPELGSVISRVQGPVHSGVPPFVALSPKMEHTPYNNGDPGFLGPSAAPFQPNGQGQDNLTLNGVTLDRLQDRRTLLNRFDNFRRSVDAQGQMAGWDTFTERAFGMLTSSKVAEAMDLKNEDKATRERYGYGTSKPQGDAAPRRMQQFLMARRLVEAGARCVTLSFSFWDWHGHNFENARTNMPDLDQGVTALVEDLHARGMDEDVTVVVWGEFGRTPKINGNDGRDHWPRVACGLLAGGGMRTGQAIGETDRIAAEPKERPVHFQEVFATLYHNLGIDPHVKLPDLTGRPRYVLDQNYGPMPEMI